MTSQASPPVIPGRFQYPAVVTAAVKKAYAGGPVIPGPLILEDGKGVLHALGTHGNPYYGMPNFEERMDRLSHDLDVLMAEPIGAMAAATPASGDPDATLRWAPGTDTTRTGFVQLPKKKGQAVPDAPVQRVTELAGVYGLWMSVKSSMKPGQLAKLASNKERNRATSGVFVTWSKEHMEGSGKTADPPMLYATGQMIPVFGLFLFLGHMEEHIRRWRELCDTLLKTYESGQSPEIPFTFGATKSMLCEMIKTATPGKLEAAVSRAVREKEASGPHERGDDEDYVCREELVNMLEESNRVAFYTQLRAEMEAMFQEVTEALPELMKHLLVEMKTRWTDPTCKPKALAIIAKARYGRIREGDMDDEADGDSGDDREEEEDDLINDGDDLGTTGPAEAIGGMEEEGGSEEKSSEDGNNSDSSSETASTKKSKSKTKSKKTKSKSKSKKSKKRPGPYDDISSTSPSASQDDDDA